MNRDLPVLRALRSLPDKVVGEALVSNDAISMRYDVDASTGKVVRPSHDLYGQSISGKVLIFKNTKGGVATGWALLNLKSRGRRLLRWFATRPIRIRAGRRARRAAHHGWLSGKPQVGGANG